MKLRYRPGEAHPVLGPIEPVGLLEFSVQLALTAAAMAVLFLGLGPRNERLLASGYAFFSPALPVDAALPLVPAMVFAYYAYFAALASIAVVTTMDRRCLYEGVAGYVGLSAASAWVFWVLPSRMDQPSLEGCATTACAWLAAMYELDGGYNVFPSMHVANTVFVWHVFRRYARPLTLPFGLVVLAIAASTVLCKRHYLVDVPAGAAFGSLGYLFARRVGEPLARALSFLDVRPGAAGPRRNARETEGAARRKQGAA